jgi:hypothetical protein
MAEARRRLAVFYRRMVAAADREWERSHSYLFINDVERRAARHLGLEKEWLYQAREMADCPGCGEKVRPGVAVCKTCGAILDREKAATLGLAPFPGNGRRDPLRLLWPPAKRRRRRRRPRPYGVDDMSRAPPPRTCGACCAGTRCNLRKVSRGEGTNEQDDATCREGNCGRHGGDSAFPPLVCRDGGTRAGFAQGRCGDQRAGPPAGRRKGSRLHRGGHRPALRAAGQCVLRPGIDAGLANPLSTDGLGNYSFYAVPGRYMLESSGPGIATKQIPDVILPNDPSVPTFTSLTTTSGISAFSLTFAANLTVTGSASVSGTLTAGGQPVAVDPDVSNAVQYVSANGDDGNNGVSWGKPKLTPYAAVTALPGGSATSFTAGAGTVFLSQAAAGNISMGGPQLSLSILGPGDLHWSSTLSSATRSGNVVTLTFAANHNYPLGQSITVYNVAGGATSFNGDFTVAATPTSTTLTYAKTGPDESATATTGQVLPSG